MLSHVLSIYTAFQKFGISKLFKSLMLIKAVFIWSKTTVILWNIIAIFNIVFLFKYTLKNNVFLWRNAEFSSAIFQYLVSHDPSEIILICWFIISVETVVLLNIYLEPVILFSLVIWWINNLKGQHLFKYKYFIIYNNIRFYYNFDPFNTSLLNKSII